MTAEQIAHVTARTVEGANLRQVGAELGVSHTTVMRALNSADVKAKVEAAQAHIINTAVTAAAHNQAAKIHLSKQLIKEYGRKRGKGLPEGYKEMLNLGHDAEVKVLQSVGILASHSQSQVVINILNQGTLQISPAITQVLQQVMGGQPVAIPSLGLDAGGGGNEAGNGR